MYATSHRLNEPSLHLSAIDTAQIRGKDLSIWSNLKKSSRRGGLNLPWLFMALSLVIATTQSALAQYCDDCSLPRVALYDSDVQVPRPTIPDSLVKWFQLFWVAGFAQGKFMNSDPSKGCITWLDGAMVNANSYQDGTLTFGTDYANVPPAGPVKSATYLITSTVTGSNGNYTFTLRLEAGESREIVKTSSQPFTYGVSNLQAAGEAAATAFMPLFQTIRTFEVNKRNSDVTVAIRDMLTSTATPEMTVTPRKTKLVLGDSTKVDITMIDCDGVPLGNRRITFAGTTFQGAPLPGSSGGTVTPTTVTTDADGKATVTFTSTSSTGPGVINGWYVHKKPCGTPGAFNGQGLVNISPRTYQVAIFGGYSNDDKEVNDSKNAPLYIWTHDIVGAFLNFVYELHSATVNPDSLLKISYPAHATDSVRGVITSLFAKFSHLDDERTFLTDGTLDGVSHWENYSNGDMTPSGTVTNFVLEWSDNSKYVDLNAGYFMQGEAMNRLFTRGEGWKYDSNPTSDSASISIATAVTQHTAGTSFTKQNGKYVGHYSYLIVDSSVSQAGTRMRDSIYRGFDFTITPLNKPTSVQEEPVGGLPLSFRLDQNYPNPFNPSTTIRYGLPHASPVTLKVYDMLGRQVSVLVNERRDAGVHEVKFDGSNLASGVYFYRMQAGSFVETRKLVLLR